MPFRLFFFLFKIAEYFAGGSSQAGGAAGEGGMAGAGDLLRKVNFVEVCVKAPRE